MYFLFSGEGATDRGAEKLLGEPASRERLCTMVLDRTIDFDKIQMPSFTAFHSRLEDVI